MLTEIPLVSRKTETIYNSCKVSFQAEKKATAEELRFVLRRLRFLSLSSSVRAIEAKNIRSYPICPRFPLCYQLICLVLIRNMFFLRCKTGRFLLKKISTYLMQIAAQNIFLEVTWCSRWCSNCLPQLILTASNIMGLNTGKVVVVSEHKCFQWCSSVYNGAYCSYLVSEEEQKQLYMVIIIIIIWE